MSSVGIVRVRMPVFCASGQVFAPHHQHLVGDVAKLLPPGEASRLFLLFFVFGGTLPYSGMTG